MRVPRVQFSVRRVMAVASVALLVTGFAAETVRRRSHVPSDRVARHKAERVRLTAERDDIIPKNTQKAVLTGPLDVMAATIVGLKAH